jgi:hypothetical protein
MSATRLAEGEQVGDVSPKLSARARVFVTDQDPKADATDAHCVALVGMRKGGLRPLINEEGWPCRGCWSTVAAPSAMMPSTAIDARLWTRARGLCCIGPSG